MKNNKIEIEKDRFYVGSAIGTTSGQKSDYVVIWPILSRDGIAEKGVFVKDGTVFLASKIELICLADSANTERSMEVFRKSASVYCNVVADDYYRKQALLKRSYTRTFFDKLFIVAIAATTLTIVFELLYKIFWK